MSFPKLITPLGLACLVVVGACSDTTGPISLPPLEVVGCYQVIIGKWSAPHDSPDPPRVVVLLDSLGTYLLEKGRPLVRAHPPGTPMSFDMAWWDRRAEEQLDLVFSDGGYLGVRLHYIWGGTTWRGSAWAFTDVSPSIQATTTSTLEPRTCS